MFLSCWWHIEMHIEVSNFMCLTFQMCTPANTPATPPNFPDALTMFSRLKASESFSSSSPSMASMATSPPPPPVSWGMTPPVASQQGLWTQGPPGTQAHPPPGWPSTVNQQAAAEQKASVAMEAERWGAGLHDPFPCPHWGGRTVEEWGERWGYDYREEGGGTGSLALFSYL